MALPDQEHFLLRLVFERPLREAFLKERASVLAASGLTDEEQQDFAALSGPGLEIDARDRTALVMGRLAASFPLTVAALSALPGGVQAMADAVDGGHFLAPLHLRPARFGEALGQLLPKLQPEEPERLFVAAIQGWETGLAATAGGVRKSAMEGGLPPPPKPQGAEPSKGWLRGRVRLAEHVVAATLPDSPEALTRQLCPFPPDALWTRIQRAPLPRSRLAEAAAVRGEGVVALARPEVVVAHRCEATVKQALVVLPGGFRFLLGALDGRASPEQLLAGLTSAGAPAALTTRVKGVLWTLSGRGFVIPAA